MPHRAQCNFSKRCCCCFCFVRLQSEKRNENKKPFHRSLAPRSSNFFLFLILDLFFICLLTLWLRLLVMYYLARILMFVFALRCHFCSRRTHKSTTSVNLIMRMNENVYILTFVRPEELKRKILIGISTF